MAQYGFITVFAGLTKEQVEQRVDHMINTLNIRDFQFYDAFYKYSQPMVPGAATFVTKASTLLNTNRAVNPAIVQAYVDHIRKRGGRSWLYVQSVGADEPNLPGYTKANYDHYVSGVATPLLYCYVPDEKWAQRMCDIWAPFALYMKFDGIHWDSLGYCNNAFGNGAVFTGFLGATRNLLERHGLLQTFNFVDGFGWNPQLVHDNVIEFPYWEVWTLPVCEDQFFKEMEAFSGGQKGVFACYTYGDRELAKNRYNKCVHSGCRYLVFGDGNRMLYSEYFPNNVEMV